MKLFGFFLSGGPPSRRTLEDILDEARPDLVHFHYLGWMLLRTLRLVIGRGLPRVYPYT